MYLGDFVFISYRGSYYEDAQKVKRWLEKNNFCKYAILYPPNTVFVREQLITPFQLFELLGHIQYGDHVNINGSAQIGRHGDRGLTHADAFVILNTEDYALSPFTQAEMMLWRFKGKEAYSVSIEGGEPVFRGRASLPSFSDEKKRRNLESQLGLNAYRASRLYKGRTPYYFGKYAHTCFMLSCPYCKNHFLSSVKAVREAKRGNVKLACPSCGHNEFYFTESKAGYHIHHQYLGSGKIEPLRVDALNQLLVGNDLPDSVGLVTLRGEVLKSEGRAVAEGMLGGLALAMVGLTLLDLFFGKDKNNE